MTLNKRRKYGIIKWGPNGVIGQAAQVAVDRYVESLGATIRTGGSQDFIVANPQTKNKNEKKMNRSLKYALRKASGRTVDRSMRPTRTF